MFADDYQRFIELSVDTSEGQSRRRAQRSASEQRSRMNERYEALFASNRDIFDGMRVLDLASHDGRYSFAALKTGAAHVTGVEVRQSLIDQAQEAFAFYDQDPETFRFVRGDIFEVLAREKFDVDVVLCFGFLYHTYRHTELMYRLRALDPKHLIVDTMVTRSARPTLKLIREEDVEEIRSAAQDPYSTRRVLVLRPSVPALRMLVQSYGFQIESMYDWKGRLAGRASVPGLAGYASGARVTLRCRSRKAAIAAGAEPVAPLSIDPRPRSDTGGREPSPGWRGRVNEVLARATGYELRRASSSRGSADPD
jgi:SAM-dependent methyltransferase